MPAHYAFIEHNRGVRQKIETWQTRMRRHDLLDLDQALADFYQRHIQNISSIHELNRFLRGKTDLSFLEVTDNDLSGGLDITYNPEAFPDTVPLAGESVPLSYAYSPGEEHDGITFRMGYHLAEAISPASVEWAVPGLRETQVAELLRSLPKTIRRQLMPFPPKVAEIVRDLRPGEGSLPHELGKFIRERYGVEVPAAAWPAEALPAHLKPRIELVGRDQKPLGAGRDLRQLRLQFKEVKVESKTEDPAWALAAAQIERFDLVHWNFGDLPEKIVVSQDGPTPLLGWPGLEVEEGHVHLKLFRGQALARQASLGGVQRLVEIVMEKDLAWLQKDLRMLSRLQPLIVSFCTLEDLQATAFENLRTYILPAEPLPALRQSHYEAAVKESQRRLPALATTMQDRLEALLKLRQEVVRRASPPKAPVAPRTLSGFSRVGQPPVVAPGITSPVLQQVQELLPAAFLRQIPFERLPHVPRYLKAMLLRMERATMNPARDRERAGQVRAYEETLQKLQAARGLTADTRRDIDAFRWLIEELKVSVFAQELGTAQPVRRSSGSSRSAPDP